MISVAYFSSSSHYFFLEEKAKVKKVKYFLSIDGRIKCTFTRRLKSIVHIVKITSIYVVFLSLMLNLTNWNVEDTFIYC